MKTGKIFSFIFILLGATVYGQVRQPHSLYFMETIPQISQMNPAFQPRANGYVMLPDLNADLCSDIALKNIFQKQGNGWVAPHNKQYDYSKLWRAIGKKSTMFNLTPDVDLLGFGFRTDNGYFSFGWSEHVSANFTVPSDLFKIIDEGLPYGTTLDFSPLRTRGMAYMQFLFGYSYRVNDKLTIGVNVKPLMGQAAISSKIDKFSLKTGEKWDMDAKGNIYSSSLIDDVLINAEGKIDSVLIKDFENFKTKDWINYATGFNNPGIAFDLGASYRIDERLTVSASLNNLGFISWKNDLKSISFGGKYTFNGVNYDIIKDEGKEVGDLFGALGDSIVDALVYDVKKDRFRTSLTPVLHAGASYKLNETISVGFLSRSAFWKNGLRQSFNASVYLQPYSFVAMNAGATYHVKGNVYLGGGFMFLLGPLQVNFLLDNVPVYWSTLTIDNEKIMLNENIPLYLPERLKTFTFRIGFNLVFGKHGYINRPMLDKGKSSWN